MELNEIQQLSAWLQASGFGYLEFSRPGERIKLTASKGAAAPSVVLEGSADIDALPSGDGTGNDKSIVSTESAGIFVATHPMRKQPFSALGARVRKGEILGLLKIGKIYAPVTASIDGVITRLIANDGALLGFAAPVAEISSLPV